MNVLLPKQNLLQPFLIQGQRHQEELEMLIQTPPPNHHLSQHIAALEAQRSRIYDHSINLTAFLNKMLTYKNNFQYLHLQYWELQRTIDSRYHQMKNEMEREVDIVRDALRNISVQDYDLQMKIKAVRGETNKCCYIEEDCKHH